MKMNYCVPLLAMVFAFAQATCQPARLVINSDFAKASPGMSVKGRYGLQIGQKITFGEYKTSKVRRGWTKGYDVPFRVRFRGAKEKLSFTQYGPDEMEAEVACISRFKSTELTLARDYFSLPLDIDNSFAGSISFDMGHKVWDFIVFNPTGDFLRDQASAGYARSSNQRIEIKAIRGMEGQPEWLKELSIFGHEFLIDGKVVAAVSTVNKGKVWIADHLDSEAKTVIAAIATGLLLRRDVEEAVHGHPLD